MTKIMTLIISILILISCNQAKLQDHSSKSDLSKSSIDISSITILPFDSSLYWIFKDCKKSELDQSDLKKIEVLLTKCIEEYNVSQEEQFKRITQNDPNTKLDKQNFIINLKRYKRQYISVINGKGEKEVWINCFCSNLDKDWKNNLVFVLDGGNCYFNLKVNLSTYRFYDLSVNGEA